MAKPPSFPILLLHKNDLKQALAGTSARTRQWLLAGGFDASPGQYVLLPDASGKPAAIWAGMSDKPDMWALAELATKLPQAQHYKMENRLDAQVATRLELGWQLARYQFSRYKKKVSFPVLEPIARADTNYIKEMTDAVFLVRDLVNTPANDMGPGALAEAAKTVAKEHGAQLIQIVGDDLLAQNYPTIHMVGRASSEAPRLLDLRWGNPKHPKLTLVGKGVCFDSGGLDLKTAPYMKLMKKDMGGAAIVLALAKLVMAFRLKVRLRVLIPAVENSVSGNAFRPLDVVKTRKGITVEVGDTDAEGRLILCDALTEADSESPDLLIDCATLTGAARTALGPDIAAFFTENDTLAEQFSRAGEQAEDHVWRLPLWKPYREMLKSQVADINNCTDGGHAGSITAALYLKEFVAQAKDWMHLDLFAWNTASRPGRPQGGEATALRALFALLRMRFA